MKNIPLIQMNDWGGFCTKDFCMKTLLCAWRCKYVDQNQCIGGNHIWGKSKSSKTIAIYFAIIFPFLIILSGFWFVGMCCAVVPNWVKVPTLPRCRLKLVCWNMSKHLIISQALMFWAQMSFSPYQHKNLMRKRQRLWGIFLLLSRSALLVIWWQLHNFFTWWLWYLVGV